jgi:4-amino-4-deoxychorismate lyase
MSVWINGRVGTRVDYRDRGLQYGDGVFETMRVRAGGVRLLDYHLQRLYEGLARLTIVAPAQQRLRTELARIAARRQHGLLKLIVTRGSGARGYRPTGLERSRRITTLSPLPPALRAWQQGPARVRLCATKLGSNPRLAGLKTLNRLESVLARSEWTDTRIWEGLMRDLDEHIVCGTMSNLFITRGSSLMTPMLDRCGVAGVMRRWVLEQAPALGLKPVLCRLTWDDLRTADEVFMSNAVVGVISVGDIQFGRQRIRPTGGQVAAMLAARLELL